MLRIVLLLLAVVAIASAAQIKSSWAKRKLEHSIRNSKSYLDILHSKLRGREAPVDTESDVDPEDEDNIMAGLIQYLQENGLLDRSMGNAKAREAPVDTDSDVDPEDEDNIMAGLLQYLKDNGLLQNVQTGKRTLDKPNIIYFLIDDLGFNDVSWHNAEVITPVLDGLAAEGMILDQAYAQPVCSPSRGALMTGLYPFHSGMQHDVIQWTSPECAPLDLAFLPEKLKSAGYSTHMLGKWHLGFCNDACTPPERGFDTFFGFYQGYIDHYTHMTGETGKEGYDWRDGADARPDLDGQYAGTLLTDRAVELIGNYDSSEPMFMYFAHSGVHTPLQSPQEFIDLYSGIDEHRAQYLAMVSQVDDTIGKVVQALKDAGMYENSVIVFQSDNGGEFHAGSNAPLRGSKTSVYEAGTRTPALFHSPLASAKGVTSNGLFHITDWYATLASMAGLDVSDVDGVDQTDLLLNNGASARSEMVYNIDSVFPQLFGSGAIRVGDWKLILGYPGLFDGYEHEGTMDLTHEVKLMTGGNKRYPSPAKKSDYAFDFGAIINYIVQTKDVAQLFNLADDPEERTNLAADNPDKVAELAARIEELRGTERTPDLSAQQPNPAGEVTNYGGIWTPGWC